MSHAPLSDVIIVGGSYAGLSAAMSLGRSLRNVLIIDGGQPCNRQTPHSHNFLTRDGEQPEILSEISREQVLKYDTVQFLQDFAIEGEKTQDGFVIRTRSGKEFRGKKIIFATGISDIMPDIKGFSECWGISVVHCPYCHGYEMRDKRTLIMANGERAYHLASLVNNLTKNLSILTSGKAGFTSEQMKRFNQYHIDIIESDLEEIAHDKGFLQSVVLSNGERMSFDCIYAALPFVQHSGIPEALGCELTEHGYIKVDSFQKTTVEGVYACGDNTAMMRSVANAVYGGNVTGAIINKELTDEHW